MQSLRQNIFKNFFAIEQVVPQKIMWALSGKMELVVKTATKCIKFAQCLL